MIFKLLKYSFFPLMLFCSCKGIQSENDVLVQIGNEKLTFAEVDNLIPKNSNPQDSINIVQHRVDQWIKETLFKKEALNNVNASSLDKQVEDYRQSLIIHHYENKILTESLDSTITKEEIQSIYNNTKQDLKLNEPAYLIFYSEVLPDDYKTIADKWKDSKWDEIEEYAIANNLNARIRDTLILIPGINEGIPSILYDNIKWARGHFGAKKVDEKWHFLQVMKRLKPGSSAPLSVIKDKLEKLILHKRRKELINKEKTRLYDKAISKNSVVIYSKKF